MSGQQVGDRRVAFVAPPATAAELDEKFGAELGGVGPGPGGSGGALASVFDGDAPHAGWESRQVHAPGRYRMAPRAHAPRLSSPSSMPVTWGFWQPVRDSNPCRHLERELIRAFVTLRHPVSPGDSLPRRMLFAHTGT